jgi:superfamily I DNA/RNA helicase
LCFKPDDISVIVNAHLLFSSSIEQWLIYSAIETGWEMTKKGTIGMVDMVSAIFNPEVENPSHYFKKYPVVFVDEYQDNSIAQTLISKNSTSGQLVCVGDTNQSVYAFNGACSRAREFLVDLVDPVELTMPMCYRCPDEVLDKVRKNMVPEIKGTGKKGFVGYHTGDLKEIIDLKDTLIITRTNLMVLKVVSELSLYDIPLTINNRNLKTDLESLLKVTQCKTSFGGLEEYMKTKLLSKALPDRIKHDLYESLLFLLELMAPKSWAELKRQIGSLFEPRSSGLIVGTAHSFKGCESENVIIYGINFFPHPKADNLEQEKNLLYVAMTRTKKNLHLMEA